MNAKDQQELSRRLRELEPLERKALLKRAAEQRESRQERGKPSLPIEHWTLRLLRETAVDLPSRTVTQVDRTGVWLGEEFARVPPGTKLVVGDEIRLAGDRYVATSPRRNIVRRLGGDGEDLLIAANVDRALLVVSLVTPRFRPRLVDRVLTALREDGVEPVVALNKTDLADPLEVESAYRRVLETGAPVVPISAEVGVGTEPLLELLRGRRTVVFGQSGVGKSTLMNRLLGRPAQKTGSTSEQHGKGRHTTTSSRLFRLEDGTEVIDTPGFRSFALEEGIDAMDGFPEFARFASECHFPDCRHDVEATCGVKEAVRRGDLPRARYEAYLRLERGGTLASEGFVCIRCGQENTFAAEGSRHRNHCPRCLWSVHVDHTPGDRASACGAPMAPIAVWVRHDGEWALVHRCESCGTIHSNRIAGDDSQVSLLRVAATPLAHQPWGS